jgi:hypothetical protein
VAHLAGFEGGGAGQVASTVLKSDSGTDNCIDQNGFDRCESDLPSVGPVISDGQQGSLASWTYSYKPKSMQNPEYHITDVASAGGTSDFIFSQFKVPVSEIALGDNGSNLAYATDGRTILAFNTASGSSGWAYSRPSTQDTLSIFAAMTGGQVNILDTNQSSSGFTYSMVPLNSTGGAGTPVLVYQGTASGQGALYDWSGQLLATQGGAGFEAIQAPVAQFAENFWPTPAGDPAYINAAGATCACDFETDETGGASPPSPPNCPICNLQMPTTQPTCITLAGSQSTYLMLIGDPGLNDPGGASHNVGNLFNLAAQTEANGLQAQGHSVVACRVSTIGLTYTALTQNGLIDGGVIYFGHSGVLQRLNIQTGAIVTQTSNIFVGQGQGADTNISATNINTLAGVQTANGGSNSIGPNAAFAISGCQAGLTIFDTSYNGGSGGSISIAQLISNNIKRGVYAYDVGIYFSQLDAQHDPHRTGLGLYPPNALPMYMVPEGAPGHKPTLIGFVSH